MALPRSVRIVEVGPRDGLQNEPKTVPMAVKVELVDRLSAAGLPAVEAGAFVSPKWVPQMADSGDVLAAIRRRPGTRYPVLVPNVQGLERALAAKVDEIAVFAAASESFSKRNINCSIAESLDRFRPVAAAAREAGVAVRGYISCVLGCPYEGEVPVARVVAVARELSDMGCYEVSLGDTIGVGTPALARAVFVDVAAALGPERVALHFHDTYGQALANILACMEEGAATIDSAVSGLGGCPYAPGAAGNVATEDVLYMLAGMGIATGIDFDALADAGTFICAALGRTANSRVALARAAKRAA